MYIYISWNSIASSPGSKPGGWTVSKQASQAFSHACGQLTQPASLAAAAAPPSPKSAPSVFAHKKKRWGRISKSIDLHYKINIFADILMIRGNEHLRFIMKITTFADSAPLLLWQNTLGADWRGRVL